MTADWSVRSNGCRLNPREFFESLNDLSIKITQLGRLVSSQTSIEAKQQNVVAVEADVGLLQFHQAACKQAGAGQQHHRKADLGDY